MKALSLAEQYYHAHLKATFLEQFPVLFDQMAFGLVGTGSECFGYDDELSKDHDWGPRVCIWVDEQVYIQEAERLQMAYKSLVTNAVDNQAPRDGVLSIQRFFAYFLGNSGLPKSWKGWLVLSDEHLAHCTNGKVFSDPSGQFSRYREVLLSYYPDDVWLKKISATCIRVSQYGQYNLQRALKRNDVLGAEYCRAEFCSQVVSLACLLRRTYKPFYKWQYRKLDELGVLGLSLKDRMLSLYSTPINAEDQVMQGVEEVVSLLIDALVTHERISGRLPSWITSKTQKQEHNYLQNYGFAVNAMIQNKSIRELIGYIPV